MSDKTSCSSRGTSRVSVVLWFVVGVLCLGEFVRVELILSEYRTRLDKIEEKTDGKDVEPCDVKTKKIKASRSIDSPKIIHDSRQRTRRLTVSSPSNDTNFQTVRKELLQTMGVEVNKAFSKACGAKKNRCPPGPPGPPGRPGRKGSTGKRGQPGRRGKRGPQGPMGRPGRSGKQGMMGPTGLKGDKGERGDPGPRGVAGRDGRPGQSISSPEVQVSPPLLIVNESDTAVLHCGWSGNPTPVIGWRRVGGLLDKTRSVLDAGLAGVARSHNLEIRNVSSNDSGVYECKGSNILGQANQTATLLVNYLPRISLSFGPIYVEEGSNVTLPKCHATGHPTPTITWVKVLGMLPAARTVINGSRLILYSVEKQDTGIYVCQASNFLGLSIGKMQLIVVTLPKFTATPPPTVFVADGESLRLDCVVTADPPARISWSKDNQQLSSDDRTRVHVNGSLTITRLKTADSGTYVCQAVSAGVFTATTHTKVVAAPKDLKFTRRTTSDYVIIKGIPSMSSVTFCFWLKTTVGDTVISYAVPGNDNELLFLTPRTFDLFIGGSSWRTDVAANDDRWHHMCTTWSNNAGQVLVYKDGTVAARRTNFMTGQVIRGGGTLIIGQEQDSVGGSFDTGQCYIGDLTGLNIWNRVLEPNEISTMSRDCGAGEGNVLSWGDVISSKIQGQVQLVKSSTCIKQH
ncbi:roundabout homolog 1-like isoform X2 [Actinia tenebrosa]|uniref:Roundabout homolog 1-like isoform X1 n=1 Tax=Actinia tenebrosa TaxID=6105 RepID=A0A6P8H9A4_ACTTE|nr:roundabout homolog 1-like isoform X1 [Actinia tenebrosa]XP_031552120.1 roundabout homolog 1-like isoform X2 [Actinia tenebrosa]